jgi:Na+/melibiose symporter-like transporter
MLAIELTEGMAKIASGSILVTALILALAAFTVKSNTTWFKALTLLVMAGVVTVAIVLFSANEKVKNASSNAASDQTRECQALLATVKQGLSDKLLLEADIQAAKNVARGLVATINASKCKPGG